MQKKVCIIGGGISGLSQAYFIKQLNPDLKIMILEKENYLGGCMQSQNIDQTNIYNQGPRSIRNSEEVVSIVQLIHELQLTDQVVLSELHNKIHLHYNDSFRTLARTQNLKAIFQTILDNFIFNSYQSQQQQPFQTILYNFLLNSNQTQQKPKQSQQQEQSCDVSVKAFLQNYLKNYEWIGFNSLIIDVFVDSALQGIYATPINQLSYQVFQKNYRNSQEYKKIQSQFHKERQQILGNCQQFTFKQGLNQLIESLKSKLILQGVSIISNTNVDQIDFISENQFHIQGSFYDYLYLCVPLVQAQKIIKNSLGQHSELNSFQQFQSNSLASVNLIFKKQIIPKKLMNSFGFLIPSYCQSNIYGCLFDSLCFPSLYQNQSVSVLVKDILYQQIDFNDQQGQEQFVQLTIQELQKYFQFQKEDVLIADAKIWDQFFPVFEIEHLTKIKQIIEYLNKHFPQLILHGNYIQQASIPYLVNTSKINAIKLKQQLQNQS